MQKRTPFFLAILGSAILGWAALSLPALAAPPFADIGNALAAGDGAGAARLADTALGAAGLNEADRARLIADRGLAHNLEGDRDGALADLTQALDAHALPVPEEARLYLERGLVLDGMNRLDDAVGDYGAALRLEPGSAPALNNRANIFRRQNRYDDARRDYLASIAADNPAPEYPYYGLGQIAEAEGKPDEARNFYTRAVAANPGYALAASRLATLGGSVPEQRIALRPPQQSTATADAALKLHPPAAQDAFQEAPQKPLEKADEMPPVPTIKPAGYSEGQLGLRPALDNPGGGGGQQIQLGAWRSEGEAAEAWNHAVKQADGALSGFAPHIVGVDLPGKGHYFRLRVETADARQLCVILTGKGLDCLPARD